MHDERCELAYFARSDRICGTIGDAWCRRDLDQDQWAAAPRKSTNLALDRLSLATVAGLADLASDRHLLALETAALLKNSGLDAELVPEASAEPAKRDRLSTYIGFGTIRGRDYWLRVFPSPTLDGELVVASVRSLIASVCELDDHRKLERERTSLWPVEHDAEGSVGIFASPVMHELLAKLDLLARSPAPVLITGETGVGKEIVARELHRRTFGPNAPFLPYNCRAVPADMLDAQLFGHRRGAFTGATENLPGVIRSAAGGTLLLDEIGELGLDIQPKLLRFLDS
jgi:transcriptional regulator of aromatic amino acid metabolism